MHHDMNGEVETIELIWNKSEPLDLGQYSQVKDVGFEIPDAGMYQGTERVYIGKKLLSPGDGLYSWPGYDHYDRIGRLPIEFESTCGTKSLRVAITITRRECDCQ